MGKKRKTGGAALAPVLLAALLTIAAPAVPAAQAGPAANAADGARLQLRWELRRKPADQQLPQGGTPARFTLTNGDSRPLPASGWSLYFTGIDRMPVGARSNGLVLEQVAGGLFRLRPGPDFQALAPGQTQEFDYRHRDAVFMPSRSPSGPYLVYDAAPDVGVALQYTVAALTEPAQRGKAGSPHSAVSAEDTYWRNARADWLPASKLPPVLPTPRAWNYAGKCSASLPACSCPKEARRRALP